MANKRNKVKFGLQNVYWAKINEWGEDPDGNKTVPAYGPSKHLPGAVSLSIDANGEAENFFKLEIGQWRLLRHQQQCRIYR